MFKKWTIFVLILFVVTACGKKQIENPLNWKVGDFNFTNQNGEEFGLGNLNGKVWIADFIFTNCEDVCLPMTYNMQKLQDMAKKEGIENLQFVSFSVDPGIDTPEILKEYGVKFNADFNNWNFLTGYDQNTIEKLAFDSFKAWVKKPQKGDQVIHGTDFYLVGPEGKILKTYTGLNEIPMEDIISDIKTLQ
ncbi:SCO family protein [Pseudoneobacillus sp. C159]